VVINEGTDGDGDLDGSPHGYHLRHQPDDAHIPGTPTSSDIWLHTLEGGDPV